MNILSKILNSVKPSESNLTSQIAREMRLKGKDVIALSSGEPDFDTPKNIKKAAEKAIKRGETKYPPTAGILELREAVVNKFIKDNKIYYSTSEIAIANGAKQIIFNALMATLNPGDEVIILSPYWVSYPDMISLCRGIPVIINSLSKDDFKINSNMLEKAITNRTKWIIFNSPANPSGSVYTFSELKELTNVLLKHPNILIMEDDIYEKLIYDENKFYTFPEVEPNLIDRILIVNGVSKSYAMTGWRVGYGAGPKKLISAMEIIQSQTTSGVSSISQWAAIEALNGSQNFFKKWKESFIARRNYVVSEINTIPGLHCRIPKGAFYIFPSCIGILNKITPQGIKINNDIDFTKNLLLNSGVALVHGTSFGTKMHFRISYAASMKELKDACFRIRKFCEDLK